MLVASWPLASRSDLQIAYDCGLYSWPNRLSFASGFCVEQVFLGQGEHAAGAGGGVVQGADDAGLGQVGVLLGEEQVDQQPDRVPRGVVVAGGLVRGLVELADDVLERVAHVGVGDDVRMQVDGLEGRDDLAQEPRLLQGEDLLLEVEVLEHIDIGREPVEVVGEVVRQPVGVGQQVGEGVVRGVVERSAGRLPDLDLEPDRVVVRRRQCAHRVTVGFEDAVEAAQDREREDHVAVLVGAVGTPKLVGDRPDEATEGAHKTPHDAHSAMDVGYPSANPRGPSAQAVHSLQQP